MTIRERIIAFLQQHPEGVDDDALTEALQLKYRQQANSRCRQLEEEGLVSRRRVGAKIHNFWIGERVQPPQISPTPPKAERPAPARPWFWEGNVQAAVIRYLASRGWSIRSVADTASRQRGKDIVAEQNSRLLWVTVKGYPQGTKRTQPSTQAGHWFKQAVFDILEYRGESDTARLGLALPDFPRYRALAQRIGWLQPVAEFAYFWVHEDGTVAVE